MNQLIIMARGTALRHKNCVIW